MRARQYRALTLIQMKLSYAISTQPTRFAAVSVADVMRLESAFARLAKLGFQGAELAVRDPAALDVRLVKKALLVNKLAVPALGTGQAFGEEGLSFVDVDASIRDRAVERIKSQITLAREIGCLVIIGLIRGIIRPPVTNDQARSWLADALHRLAETAGESSIRLAIEPINRYETNLLNTVSETLALIQEIGADNLGVLFDTFHANIEEPNMEESLRACGSRLFHVHLADSNRWAPGRGHIGFASIASVLGKMKYEGWVSAEILQMPNTEQAQEDSIKTMAELF